MLPLAVARRALAQSASASEPESDIMMENDGVNFKLNFRCHP